MDSSPSLWRCVSLCPISLSQVLRRQKQVEVESGKVDFVSTKKFWTLSKSCGSQSSEWEERKKSRVKRGSVCARRRSRKTVTCHGLRVAESVYHQASLRGRWGSWRRASRQRQPCSCLFFKTHQSGLLLCFCAESQTSGEVDQDPEGGITRQCNARLRACFYSLFFFFFKNCYHKTSAVGFFTEPLEHDTGKPCENSLKTYLIVPLFFQGGCDSQRFHARS